MTELWKYVIGVVVGSGILTPIIVAIIDRRKRRNEADKTGAETEMTVAQAAQVLNQTAVDWINALNDRVKSVTDQVTSLEQTVDSLETELRSSRDMSAKLRQSLQTCLDLLEQNNIPRPRLPID